MSPGQCFCGPLGRSGTQVTDHGDEYTDAYSAQYAEPNVAHQSPEVDEADRQSVRWTFSIRKVSKAGRNRCHQPSSARIDPE
jgi:hypothetical protein